MSAKKIFVVFGATGNQGGGVINAILDDPKASQEFALRGITRDPNSGKAKALAAKGVECVTGDINDKASLSNAFKGAHSVFAVTNYWEKMDDRLEVQQGKNVADVAKVRNTGSYMINTHVPQEAGVKHLIFSTLINVTKLSNGKYKNVFHFDSKAEIEQYIRGTGIPASFFMPGFYMSNLETMINPNPQSKALTLALPMPPTTPIPFFDAAVDSGKFVKAMVTKPDQVLGKNVFAATKYYTAEEVIKIFNEVKKPEPAAQFYPPDKDTYKGYLTGAGMPEFAAEELYENMAFMNEFGYYGKQSLDWSHSLLDDKPTTLEEFFASSKKW
ncbi:uncharacterized protein KY384_002331 [Bacidia gigantensis]|uniref:uncharacterized protein n=1 Tax=Bacidia gigantensis TaxID=2732470 RepID=UPI001D0470A8|nr:uncharacterized protein KY384_002331 [Bacidia gigantensis]KAG8532454.1 hypothetical protein KY384_002331 [Bacidia gigantensis]